MPNLQSKSGVSTEMVKTTTFLWQCLSGSEKSVELFRESGSVERRSGNGRPGKKHSRDVRKCKTLYNN